MRKVRNQNNHYSHPALMFAQGIVQVTEDHLVSGSKYDDQELKAMKRAPKQPKAQNNLFTVLLRKLA